MLVATFFLFLIRRYIELHAQGLKVYINCLRVRVRYGSPKRTHPEPPLLPIDQFLAMLRFEQRSQLAELPIELVKEWSG